MLNGVLSKIFFVLLLAMMSAQALVASPSQYCYRTSGPLNIDGKLDEPAWKSVPAMVFRGLVDGKDPKYATRCKILWDNRFFYVGFEAEDRNVWATVNRKTEQPTDLKDKQQYSRFIMRKDSFLKIFLDPDADGKRYIEIHINPYNHINDSWKESGSDSKIMQAGMVDKTHYDWNCAGLKSAVWIDGTLNNTNDVDKGWSAEVAIPWSALAEFTLGKCPPLPGDVWRGHFGRAYRETVEGERTYWTWPVIGVLDCHQTDRHGYIVFSDHPAVDDMIKNKGPDKKRLKWKMVWLWTMKDKTDVYIVNAARELGFNAIQANNTNMIAECHKAGMEAFYAIWFGSAPDNFSQKLSPKAEELKTWDNPAKALYQSGGEPVQGGEEWTTGKLWCLDCPESFEYGCKAIDAAIKAGYDGIALDAIGYQNYYACFCPLSSAKHAEYQKQHPELPRESAVFKYSQECLTAFFDKLCKHAREKKEDIKITCHIYPDFAPDPLYGNRLGVDYCGQTVSWFYLPHWEYDKVNRYAREVIGDGEGFHKDSKGAPFIGIYTLPPHEQHRKRPERVRDEIRIVKNAGAEAIMFAELGNILADPDIALVIKEELAE